MFRHPKRFNRPYRGKSARERQAIRFWPTQAGRREIRLLLAPECCASKMQSILNTVAGRNFKNGLAMR
jgi:hypothetical protein